MHKARGDEREGFKYRAVACEPHLCVTCGREDEAQLSQAFLRSDTSSQDPAQPACSLLCRRRFGRCSDHNIPAMPLIRLDGSAEVATPQISLYSAEAFFHSHRRCNTTGNPSIITCISKSCHSALGIRDWCFLGSASAGLIPDLHLARAAACTLMCAHAHKSTLLDNFIQETDGQADVHLDEGALLLVARELPTCHSLPRWSLLNARPAVAAA